MTGTDSFDKFSAWYEDCLENGIEPQVILSRNSPISELVFGRWILSRLIDLSNDSGFGGGWAEDLPIYILAI